MVQTFNVGDRVKIVDSTDGINDYEMILPFQRFLGRLGVVTEVIVDEEGRSPSYNIKIDGEADPGTHGFHDYMTGHFLTLEQPVDRRVEHVLLSETKTYRIPVLMLDGMTLEDAITFSRAMFDVLSPEVRESLLSSTSFPATIDERT